MDAKEFNERMKALPEPPNGLPPYWNYWRHDLWEHGSKDDPDLFPTWPCVYHTMLVNHWRDQMEDRLIWLRFQKDWKRWEQAMVVPTIGHPSDQHKDTPFSANLIEQAYHLAKFEQKVGVQVHQLTSIAEFGGGYGAMALLAYRLGFRGTYTICDLPEFLLLQEWYLGELQVPCRWGNAAEADLFIAAYSISEVGVRNRYRILRRFPSRYYLFLYSADWAKWNNRMWFSELRTKRMRNSHTWHEEKVMDRPDWYLFGWKNG